MAIARIRGTRIAALTDQTVEGQACNDFYEPSRDYVLADFPWNFAGKSAVLAQKVEEPEEWEFCYAAPSGMLTLRYLHAESKLRQLTDPIAYEVSLDSTDSKAIFTNLDLARVRYTATVSNVNLFSSHFVTALSWYLASEMAIPIAGTAKGRVLADRAFAGYERAIASAYSANANEGDPGPPRLPETIRAHGGSISRFNDEPLN